MYPVKQSTALTVPFFAFDSNGDGVTGIADGSWTKRISKGGGAFSAMTVTITEMENGWYSLPISSSHSDTLEVLSISLSASGAKRVNLQFRVHARVPDDLAFPNTTGRGIDVTATGEVGIDWGNVGSPTSTVNLSGTTISTSQAVASVSGNVTGSVGSISGVSFPSNFSALAITAGGIVDADLETIKGQTVTCSGGVTVPAATLASTTNITAGTITTVSGNVTGSVGSISGVSFPSNFSAMVITAGGVVDADLETIKGQTVTCSGGVTVPAATLASTTNITAGTITTVTNLTNAPTSGDLTSTMKASVNAEVLDVLNTDTFAEPGQGAPAASATLAQKINYLYKAFRNKFTQTSTAFKLYADDGTTVDQKSTVSDDGTTFTRGEIESGP